MLKQEKSKGALEAAGASDTGRARSANEDAFWLDTECGCFAVCDGMGGAAAGEVASRMTVESVLGAMTAEELSGERLQQVVSDANRRVFRRAQRDPLLAGMGTTLVLLRISGRKGWVAHVGDSRCYRLRHGQLEQLTQDHSLVDEQVRLGQLTAEQAEHSPMRNVITRAVGTQESVTADILPIEIASGDLFLLTSDGLTRELPDDAILELLRTDGELDRVCAGLIAAANGAGGRDNITCVLVRVS